MLMWWTVVDKTGRNFGEDDCYDSYSEARYLADLSNKVCPKDKWRPIPLAEWGGQSYNN